MTEAATAAAAAPSESGIKTVKLVSRVDNTEYDYDVANCRLSAVSAMFPYPIAFLKHGNDAVFADAMGVFKGLVPGERYIVMPEEEVKVHPETAADILKERFSEKERSKSPIQVRSELLMVFHKYDTNHSGDIDLAEFRSLLAELGKGITPEESEAAFKELDTDHNGAIDFKEFYHWWVTPKPTDVLSQLGQFITKTFTPMWTRL